MTTFLVILAVWAAGAVTVYCCDADPRATDAERMQYSALWPLLFIVGLVLGLAMIAGAVRRALIDHKGD